jgi:glycosyltransferase involved in cell wall biosynthesis
MKLGIIRGSFPNLSEFFLYRNLERYGILPTIIAELSPDQKVLVQKYHLGKHIAVPGWNTLLKFAPNKIRPYLKFIVEQKIGFNSPYFPAAWMNDIDVFNISDMLCYHGLQVAKHIEKHRGKKLTVTLWENIPDRYSRGLMTERIKNKIISAASFYLPVSHYARATGELLGIAREKMEVVYPGVDIEIFSPRPKNVSYLETMGIPKDKFIIVTVSRIQRSKGIDTLLNAIAYSAAQHIDFKKKACVLLVGGGHERDAMVAVAKKLKIDDIVRFTGKTPFDEIQEILSCADLFVLPSTPKRWWQEQFGFSVIESMACAVPVISTYSGALPEVISDAGILVSPGNFYALAHAIIALYKNESLRKDYAQKARHRAVNFFDANKNSLKIIQILKEIL